MLSKILEASKLFRDAYGQGRGFLLWAELLKEKFVRQGDIFSVHVPNIAFPIWLRAKTSDLEVFCQIFGHREVDFYRNSKAKYIIDAGANIGLTSVFLANRCPGAQIDSLEVDEDNVALLRKNIAPYKNISVIKNGLWRSKGFIKIVNPEASSWAFSVVEASGDDPLAIPAVGVGDLISQRGVEKIDLLKIDIEGSEIEVFGGGVDHWLPAVNMLAIELHDRFRPGCSDVVDNAVSGRIFQRNLYGEYNVFEFQS